MYLPLQDAKAALAVDTHLQQHLQMTSQDLACKWCCAFRHGRATWSLQDVKAAPKLSAEEQEHLQMMPRFFLDNAHFYCETVDVTRPFPSSHPVSQPSWEFVWNSWLAAGLRAVGLPEHCPNLLQVSGGRA